MDNKRLLILVEDYPNNDGGVSLMYVHTRNKYYYQNGFLVDVLNFKASEEYIIDDVHVITLKDFKEHKKEYDLLILHAANLKHHYRFLRKYGKCFKKYLFFYHGHEVLKINKVYSKPYDYVRNSRFKAKLQDLYDDFKLLVWRKYLAKNKYKSKFVFVSNWMRDEFIKWVKPNKGFLDDCSYVTYNCVDKEFEQSAYNVSSKKVYDFITIRGYLDGSKYCIDLVNQWAKDNPNKRFLLIGKGSFFNHYEKAANITWIEEHLNHETIKKYLDEAKCALMPTRTDAQGLMMCEMAAYGIPLITSDIPVCHEIFDGFSNVSFIKNSKNNDLGVFDLSNIKCVKDDRYYLKNTIKKEIDIINETIGF